MKCEIRKLEITLDTKDNINLLLYTLRKCLVYKNISLKLKAYCSLTNRNINQLNIRSLSPSIPHFMKLNLST